MILGAGAVHNELLGPVIRAVPMNGPAVRVLELSDMSQVLRRAIHVLRTGTKS